LFTPLEASGLWLYARHATLLEYGVDLENRKLFLVGDIVSPNVENMVSSLHMMGTSAEPITMVVNSAGGCDDMMLYLYDAMTLCPAPIYTIGMGMVCSAAALILVAGDRRSATPNCWFMTHKGKMVIQGDEDEVRAASELNAQVADRYWKLIARHTKRSAQWWFNRSKNEGELWLNTDEMRRHGVIDRVEVSPRTLKNVPKRPIETRAREGR